VGFVNGIFLWGALLAAIPVIIHLLNRRRFKVVEWAAMEWLREARIRNRRRVRLENLLLLILRAALLVLLAVLLARPFLESGVLPSSMGMGGAEHVVVLDDSMSMSVRLGRDRPWDRAVKGLRSLLERMREDTPGDRITVLRSSRPETPEVAGLPVGSRTVDECLERLAGEDPSSRRLRPGTLLAAILDRDPESGPEARRDVIVFTDLRRTDWIGAPDLPDAGRRLVERGWPVRLIDVGAGEATNLTLVSLDAEARRAVAGVPVRLNAEILNRGPEPVEGVRLAYRLGTAAPPPLEIGRLAAGDRVTVPLDVVFDEPGVRAVTVRLPADRLDGDDRRHLALEVGEATRVLIAAGDPFAIGGEGEADFLEAALSPAGGNLSGVEVEVVDESRLAGADLSRYDLVVLVDVSAPSTEVGDRLRRFVAEGGGCLTFVGERVDPGATNRALWRDGEGLLPAPLLEPEGDPARGQPVGLEIAATDHPLVRGFVGSGNPLSTLLRNVRVYRRYRLGPAADDATVILAYDARAGGRPALLERPIGRGRSVLVTTTADRAWTSWPRNPTYLVVMQEILRRTGRAGRADLVLPVGAPLERRLDGSVTDGSVRVRSPGWPEEPEVAIRAGADADDAKRLLLDAGPANDPGIYELHVSRRTGDDEIVRIAVNVEPDEGDLRRAEPEDVEAALPGVTVTRGSPEEILRGEGRFELAAAVGLLLAALVFLESFVAWLFGHHARRRDEEVTS
jgi:hypothetical protein